MLSRLVITFLPRSKRLLISWLQSPSAVILQPKNSLTLFPLFPLFPHLFPMKWWDQMPWYSFSECWALNQLFLSRFSLSSRLFSSSLLSAIRVVSSAYLRLLIFLPAILIPACASSSPVYKQSDNIQPWHTPFPIWNPSVTPCPVLTLASWLAYRFFKRQASAIHEPWTSWSLSWF